MKKTLLGLAALASMSLQSAVTVTDDAAVTNQIKPGEEKHKQAVSYKLRRDNFYFVQLQEAALANYQGEIAGYPATSVLSNAANTTQRGLLNTKSSLSKNYKNYIDIKQSSLVQTLSSKLKRPLAIQHQYNTVLNAVVVELQPEEIETVKANPEVKSVTPVGMHYLHTSSGPEFIGAKQIWQGFSGYAGTQGEGVVVGIIDTGINAYHPSFADIGADGYDHTNPLGEGNYLGDCQEYPKFCNDKLIGIVSYDIITENQQTVVDDSYAELEDKLAVGYDFNGHGSHVASTAAGNVLHDVNYYLSLTDDQGTIAGESGYNFEAISGVAPHANIVSYQVCAGAGCYTELTVLAIEHAIENGVDVINYSVGGSARDPWSSLDAVAFLNARNAGLHIATSAGNSGPTAGSIGSPGNAPWVTTVAAFTHDRGFSDKQLTSFSGGDTQPAAMSGKGATADYTGLVVHAKDFGDGQCLLPFDDGTFSGQIVVCERGSIARVRKGLNVKEGGAGGLIFINVDENADTLHADNHLLPAIHLNKSDGETLVEWLASGENHTATITASEMVNDETLGDIAGVFTSRGPNKPLAEIFSPDISGPGVDIYAANAEDRPFELSGAAYPYTTMSGTSMSSPHVAGALALIHATHPDWTPAQVQSAVMTTAHRMVYQDDDGDGVKERADFFTGGAGSIRVHQAINAGLLLDITYQDYIDANPEEGGDPKSLNSSSMVNAECLAPCSWTRTVTAEKDGTWSASYEYLNDGFSLSVSPATFTLKQGESQTLTVTVNADSDLADEWVHGYVVLSNEAQDVSDTHLQATVSFIAGVMPKQVEAEVNRVDNQVVIPGVYTIGSDGLQVRGYGLSKSTLVEGSAVGSLNETEQASPLLYKDTIFSHTFTVQPYTKRLIVEIADTKAPDMDLFVGIDNNLNGQPDVAEFNYNLTCISGREDSQEVCDITLPESATYWVFAHNFKGTEDGKPDDVTLRITSIEHSKQPSFEIETPTQVGNNEKFDIDVSISGSLSDGQDTALEEGAVYYGMVQLGTNETLNTNVGSTLLKLTGTKEPENNPPTVAIEIENQEIQLQRSESVQLAIDLTSTFNDEDGDELALTIETDLAFVLEGKSLTITPDSVGEFTVTVTASDDLASVSTDFVVKVLDVENLAPVVVNDISDQTLKLDANDQAAFSLDVSQVFTDDEAVELSVSGVEELSVIDGVISGIFTTAGTYQVVLVATDGELSTSVEFTIRVNEKDVEQPEEPDSGSSGGTISWFLLMGGLLTQLTRLKAKR